MPPSYPATRQPMVSSTRCFARVSTSAGNVFRRSPAAAWPIVRKGSNEIAVALLLKLFCLCGIDCRGRETETAVCTVTNQSIFSQTEKIREVNIIPTVKVGDSLKIKDDLQQRRNVYTESSRVVTFFTKSREVDLHVLRVHSVLSLNFSARRNANKGPSSVHAHHAFLFKLHGAGLLIFFSNLKI